MRPTRPAFHRRFFFHRLVSALLIYVLSLSLPKPGLSLAGSALRPTNTGMEESPVQEELRQRLLPKESIPAELEELPVKLVGITTTSEVWKFLRDLTPLPEEVWHPFHSTTLLMLEAMERLAPLFQDAEVLDTGAGSGVLGFVAHQAGLSIAPILENSKNFRIYALTHDALRLKEIQDLWPETPCRFLN